MKSNKFRIYSVLKNEDALPFIGDNVLISADGLGGSGSTVHKIERGEYKDFRGAILETLFANKAVVPEDLQKYIDKLISAMADDKDDTSALWASRIVIARCAYELVFGEYKDADLGNDNTRAKLVSDIVANLSFAAKRFGLKTYREDQRLLPTTLAIIRYEEKEKTVVVESLWAGDSRCYAILPDGLKALSVDDEDSTGAITNLFYAGNDKCKLNYLRRELPKPCVLMTVSDGVFDPYVPHDHLGVEATVLSAIEASESVDELKEKLYKHYNAIRGDDATIAFCAVGAPEEYRDFKAIFSERAKKISATYERYANLSKVLDLAREPEDADSYVRNRIRAKFGYIVNALVEVIAEAGNDIALSGKISEIASDITKRRAAGKRRDKERGERREKSKRSNFEDIVSGSPERISGILSANKLKARYPDLANATERFREAAQRYADCLEAKSNLDNISNELEQEKLKLEQDLRHKLNKSKEVFDIGKNERSGGNTNVYSRLLSALSQKTRAEAEEILKQCGPFDKQFIREVEEFVRRFFDCADELMNINDKIDAAKKRYDETYIEFEVARKKAGVSHNDVCNEEIFAESVDVSDDGGAVRPETVGAMDEDCKRDFLTALNARQDEIAESIVEALAASPDDTSVIDVYFNATNLKAFRDYHRLMAHGSNTTAELSEELDKLDEEYMSLTKDTKA